MHGLSYVLLRHVFLLPPLFKTAHFFPPENNFEVVPLDPEDFSSVSCVFRVCVLYLPSLFLCGELGLKSVSIRRVTDKCTK